MHSYWYGCTCTPKYCAFTGITGNATTFFLTQLPTLWYWHIRTVFRCPLNPLTRSRALSLTFMYTKQITQQRPCSCNLAVLHGQNEVCRGIGVKNNCFNAACDWAPYAFCEVCFLHEGCTNLLMSFQIEC